MSSPANTKAPDQTIRSARELGGALRAARLAQGLTQEELADIAKLTRPHLVHIEQGKTTERLDQLFRLASLLGLEVLVRPRRTHRGTDATA